MSNPNNEKFLNELNKPWTPPVNQPKPPDPYRDNASYDHEDGPPTDWGPNATEMAD